MGDKPTTDEMLSAIEQSGYLMEQKVAASISDHGYAALPNWPFADQDIGVSREIDVLANKTIYMEKPPLSILWLFCECKNNTQPLVFVGNRRDEWDDIQFGSLFSVSGLNSSMDWKEICKIIDRERHHHFHEGNVRANQFCKIVRDRNNWKANHDGVYDSILLPLAKGLEAHKTFPSSLPAPMPFAINIYYLVIITMGDLYHVDRAS